jgi:S-adenosylmethionine:tRNA ribosyltransferase-isomerase
MRLKDFHFNLPEHLIATQPAEPRDHSRLLVVDRATGTLEHARFCDLGRWITPDDLLVLNNTKVIPARLHSEDHKTELLLLEETSPLHWTAIGRPSKRLRQGDIVTLAPHEGHPPARVEVLKTLEDGRRVIRFLQPIELEHYGDLPLPPYIEEARTALGRPALQPEDRLWYQTVVASEAGSVAAPTAGLHFTPDLLSRFQHATLTLHVGLGTFRPVKVDRIEDHVMHAERYEIPPGLAEKAASARRVIAVGTTVARTLESVPDLRPGRGQTSIFIHPPYRPKRVDALITNFHLPGSTLVMLVAAFAGLDLQRKAYAEAIAEGYRFYSYGDAMLIL